MTLNLIAKLFLEIVASPSKHSLTFWDPMYPEYMQKESEVQFLSKVQFFNFKVE